MTSLRFIEYVTLLMLPTELLTHLLAHGIKIPNVNTVSIGPMKAELKILVIDNISVSAAPCGIHDVTMLNTPNIGVKTQ